MYQEYELLVTEVTSASLRNSKNRLRSSNRKKIKKWYSMVWFARKYQDQLLQFTTRKFSCCINGTKYHDRIFTRRDETEFASLAIQQNI